MNSDIAPQSLPHDVPSKALNVLSFLCPPLGLVIYLALVGKLPRQALGAGSAATKGALFYVGLVCLLAIGSLILWVLDDVFHVWGSPTYQPVRITAPPRP